MGATIPKTTTPAQQNWVTNQRSCHTGRHGHTNPLLDTLKPTYSTSVSHFLRCPRGAILGLPSSFFLPDFGLVKPGSSKK